MTTLAMPGTCELAPTTLAARAKESRRARSSDAALAGSSHHGVFRWQLVSDLSCSASPIYDSTTSSSSTPGTVGLILGSVEGTFSWRVGAWIRPDVCGTSGELWSACMTFAAGSGALPGIPPSTPSGGNVQLPGNSIDYVTGFAYWGPATNADGYVLEVYECPYPTKAACFAVPDNQKTATFVTVFSYDTSAWLAKQQQFETWINNNVDSVFQFPGLFWTDMAGTNPQTQYFIRVSAYNGWGTSDWGIWMVTGPGDYDDE
jgi:hypothetical protein